MAVEVSLTEYTKLQEQECRSLLRLLGEMGIATADRVYGSGDAIYNEGEYGDALYVLTSGVLKLFRPYSGSKEATLRLLKPWDIFGHLAFAGETRQRAYAEAVTECRVTKVPKIFVERAVRQPAPDPGRRDQSERHARDRAVVGHPQRPPGRRTRRSISWRGTFRSCRGCARLSKTFMCG